MAEKAGGIWIWQLSQIENSRRLYELNNVWNCILVLVLIGVIFSFLFMHFTSVFMQHNINKLFPKVN